MAGTIGPFRSMVWILAARVPQAPKAASSSTPAVTGALPHRPNAQAPATVSAAIPASRISIGSRGNPK